MSQVTIILGINVQTFRNVVQADWQFGWIAICPKQNILMALNTCPKITKVSCSLETGIVDKQNFVI
jgi:hypothetical protein